MTMFKPNIQIEHLSVYKSGQAAYSESFHSGLNIIRGENSSGKSTLMDFLFYGLGGDLSENQWRETASICDEVFMGVSLNGNRVTLSREIDSKSSRPMRIFMGPWEEAKESANEGWEKYPYRRGEKDSFSQALFKWLALPEVQYGTENTKITMNQILRLIYSDQISPMDKIFKSQLFDDAITRQTVGDLLCGAYSDKFYGAKLRKREAEAELSEINSRKTFLIRTHGKDGHPLNMDWLEQERKSLERDITNINSEIEKLEKKIFEAQFDDRLTLNDQEKTYEKVVSLQTKIGGMTAQLNEVQFEHTDSADFINAIESKLAQLNESGAVVEQFKNLSFEFCPACLAPIKSEEVEGACSLCKSAHDHELTKKRSTRLINEYQRQHEQSLSLQDERAEKILSLRSKIATQKELFEQASAYYRVALRTPTTKLRSELRGLNRKAGYTYRNLEELGMKREIIEEIESLNQQLLGITNELNTIKIIIDSEAERVKLQKQKSYAKIEEICLWFLKKDLERQSSFKDADRFKFEFDGDRLSVNDESFFSASSMVYMRNSFLASFLFAAAEEVTFAHPRLLIMDTIEDKGMEPERSQNFQRQLLTRSKLANSEHQIIIATSMIAPELNTEEFTVGKFYTHDDRSLKILG